MLNSSCLFPKIDEKKRKKLSYFKFQLKNEKNRNFKHMYDIGNFKPNEVYFGENKILENKNIINGLCSLCENPIHISIGINPSRLILSHCINDNGVILKDECFYIYDLYDTNHISQITQYDIYNSIQSYIYHNKKYPKYIDKKNSENTTIAI